ncbi:DUF2963 domain-containing protein [Candidatus Phytoplasma solani]|uniref:DUF2963 domain-containing protein n=1 Tax=Candidatus Phytoplasma solani TaxID=69896 RepID=UPI00358F6D83
MKHRDDGTIESISEFDQTTGKEIKKTIFQSDGQTIDSIIKTEYDQVTNQKVKETHYQDNGEKINYINELDIETGGLIRQNEYRYRNDGTIEAILEFKNYSFINKLVKETRAPKRPKYRAI